MALYLDGVFQGSLSGVINLDGSLTATQTMSGNLSYNENTYPTYEGEYVVTPLAWEQTVLDTGGKLMYDDVTVLEIPYYRTSNPQGGDTIFIGYQEANNG